MGTDPHDDDEQIVTWWGLVIEGYQATHARVMAEIAEAVDLTPASFDILLRLVRSPDCSMPMTRLARESAFSSGGFTKIADRLTQAGLLRRERCEADRRVTYAVLTDHGREVAERAKRACADSLRRHVVTPLGTEASAALADAMRTLRTANAPAETSPDIPGAGALDKPPGDAADGAAGAEDRTAEGSRVHDAAAHRA